MPMMAEPAFPPRCGGRAIQVGDQPAQFLPLGEDGGAPRFSRRGTARISAIVISAVSSVKNLRRVGYRDGRAACAAITSIFVDAVAEIGDQLEVAVGLLEQLFGDLVGDGRYQDIGGAHGRRRSAHSSAAYRRDLGRASNQLAHAGLYRVRQLARDDKREAFFLTDISCSHEVVQTSLTRVVDTAAAA